MKALITGGLGFIGSHFIKSKIKEYPIFNLDKLGFGSNLANLSNIQDEPKYEFIKGDIQNTDLINTIINDVDLVINFAAETHVDRSIKDPSDFVHSNILGTYTLLEAERKQGRKIRHIQVSTDETYGSCVDHSFREGDSLNPSNPYSATKAAADLLCQSYHKTYGMDILITRCTNNYGPHQFPEKLIPKTIIRASHDLKIPIYGTGENIRDWIYVLDHCAAIDFVSKRGKAGEIYNVSSGNEVTNLALVERILELMCKPRDYSSTSLKIVLGTTSGTAWTQVNFGRWGGNQNNHLRKGSVTIEWYNTNDDWWKPLITPDILSESPWK